MLRRRLFCCVLLSRLLLRNVALCFKEPIGHTGDEEAALERSRKQHLELQTALVFLTVSAVP